MLVGIAQAQFIELPFGLQDLVLELCEAGRSRVAGPLAGASAGDLHRQRRAFLPRDQQVGAHLAELLLERLEAGEEAALTADEAGIAPAEIRDARLRLLKAAAVLVHLVVEKRQRPQVVPQIALERLLLETVQQHLYDPLRDAPIRVAVGDRVEVGLEAAASARTHLDVALQFFDEALERLRIRCTQVEIGLARDLFQVRRGQQYAPHVGHLVRRILAGAPAGHQRIARVHEHLGAGLENIGQGQHVDDPADPDQPGHGHGVPAEAPRAPQFGQDQAKQLVHQKRASGMMMTSPGWMTTF